MRWAMSPTHKDFSPLFIGEITSTSRLAPGIDVRGEFQSPLHRGNHFNFNRGAIPYRKLENFSPLFIGEITSTCAPLVAAAFCHLFQSPLHRGNHFNGAECCAVRSD